MSSKVKNPTIGESWAMVLEELKHQMVRGTFDKLFSSSTAVRLQPGEDGQQLVVQLPDDSAATWVAARGKTWENTINTLLTDIHQTPTSVVFVLDGQPGPKKPSITLPPDPPEPHPNGTAVAPAPIPQVLQDGEVTIIRRPDPYPKARPAGYMAIPHYAIRFWRPFLGALPFDLYMLMNSFWHDVAVVHSREDWPSLSELAMCMGIGDRSTLTGRERPDGINQTGLIQILEDAGLFRYRSEGKGRGTKHIFDAFLDIDDQLPLLSPAQVYGVRPGHPAYPHLPETLRPLYTGFPARLQRMHEQFIVRWERKLGIGLDEWQGITELTLVPPIVIQPK